MYKLIYKKPKPLHKTFPSNKIANPNSIPPSYRSTIDPTIFKSILHNNSTFQTRHPVFIYLYDMTSASKAMRQ